VDTARVIRVLIGPVQYRAYTQRFCQCCRQSYSINTTKTILVTRTNTVRRKKVRDRSTSMVNITHITHMYNDCFDICLIDIETLLNLGRRIKIPGYKIWKNICSDGYLQTENEAVENANKTLYGYIQIDCDCTGRGLIIAFYS